MPVFSCVFNFLSCTLVEKEMHKLIVRLTISRLFALVASYCIMKPKLKSWVLAVLDLC